MAKQNAGTIAADDLRTLSNLSASIAETDDKLLRHRLGVVTDAALQARADEATRALAAAPRVGAVRVEGYRAPLPAAYYRLHLLMTIAKYESDGDKGIAAMTNAAAAWRELQDPTSGYVGNAYRQVAILQKTAVKPIEEQFPNWKAWADIMYLHEKGWATYIELGDIACHGGLLKEAEDAYAMSRKCVLKPKGAVEHQPTIRLVERILIPAGRIDDAMALFREDAADKFSVAFDLKYSYFDDMYFVAMLAEDAEAIARSDRLRKEAFAEMQASRNSTYRPNHPYAHMFPKRTAEDVARDRAARQAREHRDQTAGYLGSLGLYWKERQGE